MKSIIEAIGLLEVRINVPVLIKTVYKLNEIQSTIGTFLANHIIFLKTAQLDVLLKAIQRN